MKASPFVIGREGCAPVEVELHGRGVSRVAQDHRFADRGPLLLGHLALRRALRVDPVLAPDVGPAIKLALDDVVELLRLDLIAQEIHALVHAPELAGRRVPIEADGVAQATGKDGA